MAPQLDELLARLDAYLDTAPQAAARVERIGPLALFVPTGPWRFYARPTPGRAAEVTAEAVVTVRERQRELGLPESYEWIRELAPRFGAAAQAAGLEIRFNPLLALSSTPDVPAPPPADVRSGMTARVLDADDPALAGAMAAVEAGFRAPGTAAGSAGPQERDKLIGRLGDRIEFTRAQIAEGFQIVVVAETDAGPVAGGTVVPRGDVAELVGIATLPSWRRRGIGALITRTLAEAAGARGVRVLMLSAADQEVARIYERVGFRRVGAVGEAAPPAVRPI